MSSIPAFSAIAPGRVCLFGEHSDYLGLDVIPAAISLCMKIECTQRNDNTMEIDYSDLKSRDSFDIDNQVEYQHDRDYVRSAYNVLKRNDIQPSSGWSMKISGTIPMAGGLSSSSALSVAAILAFSQMANENLDPETLAHLAFEAEVKEFGESGGMMDHYASAFGEIIHLIPKDRAVVTRIPARIRGLVIGDSGDKKEDTVGSLARIRSMAMKGYRELSLRIDGFDQRTTSFKQIQPHLDVLSAKIRRVVEATLRNRDLTQRANIVLRRNEFTPQVLGKMIHQHHVYLRDGLDRSTGKIEEIISAAREAGALGCKINGSGGGGTMMAYCPGKENEVYSAIERAGGTPHIVSINQGAHLIWD